MSERISFRINYEKAIEAIIWLANEKPGIDIYHIAKVLFYAEKSHVNKYARPIIGDNYICMDYGPVPSGVRDLINKNSWLSPDHLEEISRSLIVEDRPYPSIRANRKPMMDHFSRTDIECLRESLNEYGDKTFAELKELTHNEACWIEAGSNQSIDYALMVDENNPMRKEIIEEMLETAAYLHV
jgi:uncharacterized phage-associated protein